MEREITMRWMAVVGAVLVTSSPAAAAETQTNSYDARGRLKKVERSGSVNNGVKVEYTHDKAENRVVVIITGSSQMFN